MGRADFETLVHEDDLKNFERWTKGVRNYRKNSSYWESLKRPRASRFGG